MNWTTLEPRFNEPLFTKRELKNRGLPHFCDPPTVQERVKRWDESWIYKIRGHVENLTVGKNAIQQKYRIYNNKWDIAYN